MESSEPSSAARQLTDDLEPDGGSPTRPTAHSYPAPQRRVPVSVRLVMSRSLTVTMDGLPACRQLRLPPIVSTKRTALLLPAPTPNPLPPLPPANRQHSAERDAKHTQQQQQQQREGEDEQVEEEEDDEQQPEDEEEDEEDEEEAGEQGAGEGKQAVAEEELVEDEVADEAEEEDEEDAEEDEQQDDDGEELEDDEEAGGQEEEEEEEEDVDAEDDLMDVADDEDDEREVIRSAAAQPSSSARLTQRQRAMYAFDSEGVSSHLMSLPALKPKSDKQRYVDMDEEGRAKWRLKEDRRRQQQEEEKTNVINKLLARGDTEAGGDDSRRQRQQQAAQQQQESDDSQGRTTVRYVQRVEGTTYRAYISFPPADVLVLPAFLTHPTAPPPVAVRPRCTAVTCNSTRRFVDKASGLSVCSLACLKQCRVSAQPAIVAVK